MSSDETQFDTVLIRDMVVQMSVGIHVFEKEQHQRVIINVDISVPRNTKLTSDDINDVLSYADIAADIEHIAASDHFNLVETFAEKIATTVLGYKQAHHVRVRVEKPDIFDNIAGVGVEIFRSR